MQEVNTSGSIAVFNANVKAVGVAIVLELSDKRQITLYPPVVNEIAMVKANMCAERVLKDIGNVKGGR